MQTEGTEVSKQQDTRGTKLTKFKCSAKVWKPISGVPDPICRSDAREVQVYSLDPMLGEALMGTTNEYCSPSGKKQQTELAGLVHCSKPLRFQEQQGRKWVQDMNSNKFECLVTEP